ncbi:protein CUP-SHAPED COTYLEDON 3-like [Andrographis paniculata]|uniref:protein CUP-SHAPED COTYLEDON 3-like n=1 Tax=Andrographis paniculata TaxID=175694 RepID=UPI0021E70EF4|nr:protein CUP-SHAPED COTYLEDON 3-like [Andrographis paniculata]
MGLRDIGESLPPGFRFYPSDEELVCHYLYKKIANEELVRGTLVEIDLHVCEPWQLPDVAKLNSDEWYFFSFRDRKYTTGFRTNRATTSGYWKATGKDRVVVDPRTRAIVGMRKTLVFYRNRAPNGIKTGWIMHEFRLENPHVPPKEDWVLCRVFHKSRGSENSSKLMNPNESFHGCNPNNFPNNLSAQTLIDSAALNPQSDHHQNMTNSCGNYHHQPCPIAAPPLISHGNQNPSTSIGQPAAYLPVDQTDHQLHLGNVDQSKTNMVEAKCEDDYGFMFDFDGSNGAVPSSLDDMGFDDDDGSVFL